MCVAVAACGNSTPSAPSGPPVNTTSITITAAGANPRNIQVALGSLTHIKARLAHEFLPPRTHRLKRYSVYLKLNHGAGSLPEDLKSIITGIEEQYVRRS